MQKKKKIDYAWQEFKKIHKQKNPLRKRLPCFHWNTKFPWGKT
jgi:hypothetical protein